MRGIKATAAWDDNKDLVRLDVTDFFKDKKTTPGMYYFVYEPGRLRGYESHPFTLCTWNYSNAGSIRSSENYSLDEKRKDSEANGIYHDDADLKDVELGINRVGTSETIPDTRGSREARHTFLVRPRDGFTQRLRKLHSRDFHVLIEGPYGSELDMHQYGTVVMIVGGSGITAAISRAYALLRCGSPRSVRLVWAAQKQDMADDVCTHELSGLLGKSRFELDVFITSAGSKELKDSALYTLHTGRPDVDKILDEERGKCVGSMAVFCCGPAGLDIRVRNTVRRLLGEEGPHVAFLEERFSW